MPHGGPDGGDGGPGGDVVIRADAALSSLNAYRERRRFAARTGGSGAGGQRTGRAGGELVLAVPPGTVVSDPDTGEVLADLDAADASVIVAEGGRGGRGNARFASATRQAPRARELGEPGRRRRVHLVLKLIADAGLVGLPNAGKSTLLAAITGAHPRIAAYPFTTLSPNLGVAEEPDGRTIVVADVPGLIEGAHTGHGLGIAFLRHLERTRVLVHVVDASAGAEESRAALAAVAGELAAFSPALAAKPRLLVFAKADLSGAPETAAQLGSEGEQGLTVSGVTGEGCAELVARLGDLVRRGRAEETEGAVPASGSGHHVYRHRPEGLSASRVTREADGFRLSGAAVERLVAMTDLGNDESLLSMQRKLRRAGIESALAGAGCADGDTVRVGDVEFAYHSERDG